MAHPRWHRAGCCRGSTGSWERPSRPALWPAPASPCLRHLRGHAEGGFGSRCGRARDSGVVVARGSVTDPGEIPGFQACAVRGSAPFMVRNTAPSLHSSAAFFKLADSFAQASSFSCAQPSESPRKHSDSDCARAEAFGRYATGLLTIVCVFHAVLAAPCSTHAPQWREPQFCSVSF